MMMRYLDEAVETCETLLQPDNESISAQSWTEACQTVGNILTGMGFVEESYPWRSMALDETPNAAQFYAESGRVYSQCEVWDRAIYFCQRTLEHAPDNVTVRHRLAKIYNQTGNYRQESQTLNELLALQPDKATAEGHHQLGRILEQQGQNQAAQNCYERAIAQDDRYATAYYALGDLLAQQGQRDRAIALFEQLISILESAVEVSTPREQANEAPDESPEEQVPSLSSSQQQAMAHYRLGRVHRQSGQLEQAVVQFRQSLKLDAHLHWAYMGLLNTLIQMQRWDEVIAPCQKLVHRADEFPWIYTFMGNALAGKEEWAEAAVAHQKAFERRGWTECAERGYAYGQTWFAESIPVWETHLAAVGGTVVTERHSEDAGRDYPLYALSLGSSDAASLCWLIDKVLSHREDRLICLAPQISESLQHNASKLAHPEKLAFEAAEIVPYLSDESAEAADSEAAEPEAAEPGAPFSLIVVQGDRREADYLRSLLPLAWERLTLGGILIVKDYQWTHPEDPAQSSQIGIDDFVTAISNSAEILHRSHQLMLKKTGVQALTKETVVLEEIPNA